jgi:hypothetical protein
MVFIEVILLGFEKSHTGSDAVAAHAIDTA